MLSRVSLFSATVVTLFLLATLTAPLMSFAQDTPPASSAPAFAPKQTGGTVPDSAPKFSSAGLTVKLVSISKNKDSIAVSLMVQNNNTYPVLTATLYTIPFTLVDNEGHRVSGSGVSGFPECRTGLQEVCLILSHDKDSRKPEQYLQIDPGSAAIANMSFNGSDMGDTVTVAGGLAVIPWAEKNSEDLVGKPEQPRKGKAINIAIPLIPLR